MRNISESFGKIGDEERQFDVRFWQSQSVKAIFDAASEMALDYLRLRFGYVDKPRLERTVESFQEV